MHTSNAGNNDCRADPMLRNQAAGKTTVLG
jgi:hypothetical protein